MLMSLIFRNPKLAGIYLKLGDIGTLIMFLFNMLFYLIFANNM